MIVGIGVDITEIARIASALKRFGPHFLHKILSPREEKLVHGNIEQFLAGRFAAKEAAAKALGTGFRNFFFTEIEILQDPLGCPQLSLTGKALERAQALSVENHFVSISHERNFAVAMVVLERISRCPA